MEKTFEHHLKWGDAFQKAFTPYHSYEVDLSRRRQLRIGYVSPDFFTHSVSYFIEPLLKNHSADDFFVVW